MEQAHMDAWQILHGLEQIAKFAFDRDPQATVKPAYDPEHGWYYHVQLRKAQPAVMSCWGASFPVYGEATEEGDPPLLGRVPVYVELVMTVVTTVKPLGDSFWKNTKYANPCIIKADLFEPVFVLRAQDSLAEETVEFWIEKAREAGTPESKIRQTQHHKAKIAAWPTKKVPD